MTAVLDASAMLAFLQREPGHERVAELLHESLVSTVNLAEVTTTLTRMEHSDPVGATTALVALGATAVPFGQDDATKAGSLWPVTRKAGLSLGDRACLTLALRTSGGFAVTTDRVWSTLNLDVRCEVIRGDSEAGS